MKDIINSQVNNNPNKTFIIYNNQLISYIDFNYMVNHIVKNIKQYKQQYIGIQLRNKLKLLVTIIAINRTKKIPVIYPYYPNIKEYTDITDVPISIKDNDVIINKTKINKCSTTYKKNDTQIVIFTSGSTGTPKACELSFNNLYQSALLWDEVIRFNRDDCYLNHMPLTHISGISIFFRALYYNFIMALDDFNASGYSKFIKNHKINIISMVPYMLKKVIDENGIKKLDKLKTIIIGGSNINQELLHTIKINKIPTYISYGMTETSSGIAGFWANKKPIYQPHKNVDINVDKTKLNITSKTIMVGYMHQKKLNGIFQTNDKGKIYAGNLFSIYSRIDDLVNSGGEKFSSTRVKQAIEKFKEVHKCEIKIIKDNDWGHVVHAYIKLNIKIDKLNLYNKIKNTLPNYMVPKKIIIQ